MAMNLNSQEQERVNNVYNEREAALAENEEMYSGLMNQAGQLRDEQNSYLAEQERVQNEVLDKQLANQQNLINQQKDEAARNKRVETNKALNDYNAYINPYGLQAERQAEAGLTNSGVSETSKLGAYNSYQNRVATAGAAYQKAVTEYDNAMNEAVLNNDVQKAQNALKKLELQLQNNRDYYSNISSLSQAKLENKQNLSSDYFNRYNQVYNQIMQEQATAESIRQYNEQMAFEREKQAEAIRQYNESLAYQKQRDAQEQANWEKQYNMATSNKSSSGGNGGSSYTATLTNGSTQNETASVAKLNNSAATKAKSDYYFKTSDGSQGYQPRYINNNKLSKTGKTLKDVGTIKGVSGNKNIWTEGGRYYVWDEDHYIQISI